ncbi:LCP family protein [Streptomyces abyssomicinicus]|uniref:LCP family protein n=1 Tax=Streptomyces abyssomicinicus TaxID=574929 RepID=UPI0012505C8D|nr:LCP family protein [Streptomyces abyssomicinicus]
MAETRVRGEDRRRGSAGGAADLGWDDSLYEADGPGDGPAGRHGDDSPTEPRDGGRHGGRRGNGRRRGRGGRRRRVLRWTALILAFLIVGAGAAGYLYYQHLNDNIDTDARAGGKSNAKKAKPNAAGQTPLNILVLGSDDRNDPRNLKLGGSKENVGQKPRADVQMLLHLSADRKSASMVSIPRDTMVNIPECRDAEEGTTYPATYGMINSTLQRGGPGCTLSTWENLTGVYIDHWIVIDFIGVVEMADAIGGVDVCVEENVWDRSTAAQRGGSGLKLEAGTHPVKGEQALQWLRTRHAWGSDQMRAKAQQMYINSMMRELQEQNIFTDSGELMDLAEAATNALKVSEEIGSVAKLAGLAMEMKEIPINRITTTTMPNDPWPQDPNRLIPRAGDADKLWAMLQDDVPFDRNGTKGEQDSGPKDEAAPDGQIAVQVRNGTASQTLAAVQGRAGAIQQVLAGQGFALAAKDGAATKPAKRTVVQYPSADLKGDALRVAESLGIPASSVKKSADVNGVTLTVGADWREGDAYPKENVLEEGDLPESAGAQNGEEKNCMKVAEDIYTW